VTGQLEHPNIVPIHELGEDKKGNLYFTMKFVRGRSLAQVLKDMAEATAGDTEPGEMWVCRSNFRACGIRDGEQGGIRPYLRPPPDSCGQSVNFTSGRCYIRRQVGRFPLAAGLFATFPSRFLLTRSFLRTYCPRSAACFWRPGVGPGCGQQLCELLQVERGTDPAPFRPHFVEPTQQELADSHGLLDERERRFRDP